MTEMTLEEEEEEAEEEEEEEEQIGVEEERKIGEGKEDVGEEDVTLRPRMVLIMRMMEAITKGGAEVCFFFFRLYYEFFCPQNLESFFFICKFYISPQLEPNTSASAVRSLDCWALTPSEFPPKCFGLEKCLS